MVIFSKTPTFRHDSIPDGIVALTKIGQSLDLEVIATEDANFFLSPKFSEAKIIVFLNTTGNVLNEPEEKNIEKFIRSGGGFLGIHSAADTEYEWDFYTNLVGAQFKSHPAIQRATVTVIDDSHPCTCHLPKKWERTDEWYDYRSQPKNHVITLLNLEEATYEGGQMGSSHPIAWCHETLGGRALYTGGGHTKESFQEPLFVEHLTGAVSWIIGKTDWPTKKLTTTIIDELTPTFPDQDTAPSAKISRVDAAKGTIASFHVAIEGLRIGEETSFRIHCSKNKDLVTPFLLKDVPVEENTGLGSRTEQWEGKINPHVIRRAPFRIHEILLPLEFESNNKSLIGKWTPTSSRAVLRIEKEVLHNEPTGNQVVGITILQPQTDKGPAQTTLNTIDFHTHAAIVPPVGEKSFFYTNWFSPSGIAKEHDVEKWSEEHWELLKKYAQLMAKGRQNTFWFRWHDFFEKKNGRWILNKDRARRFVNTFTKEGLWWIEGAPIARRPNGDWGSTNLELSIASIPAEGPVGSLMLRELSLQVKDLFEEENWTGRWIQHISDEPTDTNAEAYRTLSKKLQEIIGEIPIVEATMSTKLIGAVNIWCPKTNDFQNNFEFFTDRMNSGDRVWTYTCLAPGGPWVNRLLDQERIRQVVIGWGAFLNQTSGFLHWGLSHWKANPFLQSVVDHPAMPKTKNKLPAGDTHIVYPGTKGPLSGLRLEAHRVGLEDYELLKQLKNHNSELASSIAQKIFNSYDNYEKELHEYRSVRRKLIESLSKHLQENNNKDPGNK